MKHRVLPPLRMLREVNRLRAAGSREKADELLQELKKRYDNTSEEMREYWDRVAKRRPGDGVERYARSDSGRYVLESST